MKRKIPIITAIVLILVSLSLFIYPEISKAASKREAIQLAENFDNTVKNIVPDGSSNEELYQNNTTSNTQPSNDESNVASKSAENLHVLYQCDIDRMLADCRAYNEQVAKCQNLNSDFTRSALDLTQYGVWNGIFGYIEIPELDLVLPIYLGSSGYNMSYGVTHLMGTSLPIGGESTNSAIAGHTGYVGKEFFDALPALSPGDSVFVTSFWGTHEYKVVFGKVIGPTDSNELSVQNGKDLLSLLTCADYGTKRYLVQCKRNDTI